MVEAPGVECERTGRVVFPMPYEATTDDKFDVEVSDKGIVVVL